MAALYPAPAVFRPARAEVTVDVDAIAIAMPDGRSRRHGLHGSTMHVSDGSYAQRAGLRRFVRMLTVARDDHPVVLITPPELGAVAPGVVRVPDAGADAAIVEPRTWDAIADWLAAGGRLASCSIGELARLATIATSTFATLIGEVAAQRALELAFGAGPLRGGLDPDVVLAPFADAARSSSRAAEAFVAALAHTAGAARRRRRW